MGDSQIAFQPLRNIAENIELMTEVIRYCEEDEEGEGGIAFILDNSQAYDRVQWPFLQATLRAFGIPEAFARMVAAMYAKSCVRLKVNGTLGPEIEVRSGVKQGCPLSCALYVLVATQQGGAGGRSAGGSHPPRPALSRLGDAQSL